MRNKPKSFWLGLVLVTGGLFFWAYRILWASQKATCPPLGVSEFAPLL